LRIAVGAAQVLITVVAAEGDRRAIVARCLERAMEKITAVVVEAVLAEPVAAETATESWVDEWVFLGSSGGMSHSRRPASDSQSEPDGLVELEPAGGAASAVAAAGAVQTPGTVAREFAEGVVAARKMGATMVEYLNATAPGSPELDPLHPRTRYWVVLRGRTAANEESQSWWAHGATAAIVGGTRPIVLGWPLLEEVRAFMEGAGRADVWSRWHRDHFLHTYC
jgi:hypothetical protein